MQLNLSRYVPPPPTNSLSKDVRLQSVQPQILLLVLDLYYLQVYDSFRPNLVLSHISGPCQNSITSAEQVQQAQTQVQALFTEGTKFISNLLNVSGFLGKVRRVGRAFCFELFKTSITFRRISQGKSLPKMTVRILHSVYIQLKVQLLVIHMVPTYIPTGTYIPRQNIISQYKRT